MPIGQFKEFLTALRDRAGAKLCGSMASGKYDLGHLSDIDLVVRMVKTEELGKKRPMTIAIEVFKEFGVPGDSILIGQFSSPRDATTLPRPIEIMETFWVKADKSLPKTVTIYDVTFETFRR